MKRFFILFLVMLAMMPVSSAFAIEFHGIPWGISVNELVAALKERNISVEPDDVSSNANMAVWTYEFRNSFYNDIENTGHMVRLYFYKEDKPSIAGHPVKQMQFYAHYDISDGVLKQNADDSHYYMAQISFDVSDEKTPGVYDDLYKKLTGLYGSGIEDSTYIVDTTYTYTVWKDTDNTAVCLYRSESTSNDYQFLNLWYGNTEIEETLHTVRQLVIESEIQAASLDTSGL